jgi:hypothetical protein
LKSFFAEKRKIEQTKKNCPKGKQVEYLPLDKRNPPRTIMTRIMNIDKTFETIMFLAAPPMNRKRDAAI